MIKVRGYRVLVKPDPAQTETESGIVYSMNKKLEKTGVNRGVLVAVGETAWQAFRVLADNNVEKNGKPWAKPGDYVVFARHAGKYMEDPFDPDNEYLVMNDEDIIAVMTEGTNPDFKSEVQKQAIAN